MEEEKQHVLGNLNESGKEKHQNSAKKIALLLFCGICLCLLFIFIFVTFPRYITPDFPPPNHTDTYHEYWEVTSHTVQSTPLMPDYLYGRVFIWRRETTVTMNPTNGGYTRQNIIAYLDEKFLKFGWKQTELYTPCRLYFPEAKLLPSGDNGYLSYRRVGYEEMNSYRPGDFICLAVWEDEPWGVYDVSFITVSLSPLDMLFSISMHETMYDDRKFFVTKSGFGI